MGFPGGSGGKESTCNAGDLGSIPGLGRSLGKGMATHSSILAWRIPKDRGDWQATVHRVTKRNNLRLFTKICSGQQKCWEAGIPGKSKNIHKTSLSRWRGWYVQSIRKSSMYWTMWWMFQAQEGMRVHRRARNMKFETWNPITLRGAVMKAKPRQGH